MSSVSRVLVFAGAALLIVCAATAPAGAFAVWQGRAVIGSAPSTECTSSGIGRGTEFRVFFKPANVGGNSSGSELLFAYDLGAFTMRRVGDLSGTGTYDGDAVFFSLHNAGSFVFAFHRSVSGAPFDITIAPETVGTATQKVVVSGRITNFFGLFTASSGLNCDVTFRANLLRKP